MKEHENEKEESIRCKKRRNGGDVISFLFSFHLLLSQSFLSTSFSTSISTITSTSTSFSYVPYLFTCEFDQDIAAE